MKDDDNRPQPETPMAEAHFGTPDDCEDLVNKYGTYNVQSTADTENIFPLIAHGLPRKWRDIAMGKQDVESEE